MPIDIKRVSRFNSPEDQKSMEDWVEEVQKLNNRKYEQSKIETSLGTTVVYRKQANSLNAPKVTIFPGFRTSSLIWDLDLLLDSLGDVDVYMIETNGQPNLSEGNSPAIKGLGYGHWANEVLDGLKIDRCHIVGASFGGLVCMKLAIVNPAKIISACLLNPACFRFVSMAPSVMIPSILPVLKKNRSSILNFLNKVVFHKPNHQFSARSENLLVDYQLIAIKNFQLKAQTPYNMGRQLKKVSVPVHLILGKNDPLFPIKKTINNAENQLEDHLKSIKIFEDVGHGIECYKPAIEEVGAIIKTYDQ